MILLRPDCLVFKNADDHGVPASALEVTLELVGASASWLEQEVVENAAEAVLHYFKEEKGQSNVSLAEFSKALARALRGLGVDVKPVPSGTDGPPGIPLAETGPLGAKPSRVVDEDLQALAGSDSESCELFFFTRLRDTVRARLDGTPVVLRFRGLKGCVKQLAGARRWSPQCQQLQDWIVEYLRLCLAAEGHGAPCLLVVR